MKYLVVPIIAMLLAVACSSGPVFNGRADQEQGHDHPCTLNGQVQPGWHQCQFRDTSACCPDTYSCSSDDFVPSQPPYFCRSRGDNWP